MIKQNDASWSICLPDLNDFHFYSFSQEAIDLICNCRVYEINVLEAIHELELFAIKYGKIHFTENDNKVRIQHNLFGEFGALFDESDFVIFSWIFINLHPASYSRSYVRSWHKELRTILGLYLLSAVSIVRWLICPWTCEEILTG